MAARTTKLAAHNTSTLSSIPSETRPSLLAPRSSPVSRLESSGRTVRPPRLVYLFQSSQALIAPRIGLSALTNLLIGGNSLSREVRFLFAVIVVVAFGISIGLTSPILSLPLLFSLFAFRSCASLVATSIASSLACCRCYLLSYLAASQVEPHDQGYDK